MNPVNFAGNSLYRAGSYAKRNIEAGGKAGGVPLNIGIILGRAEGGIPFNATGIADEDKVMWFTSFDDAKSILLGGDLLQGVKFAFDGSNDARINAGVGMVGVIRVDNATKSDLTLNNTSAAGVIKIESTNYGLSQNSISVNVSTGTNAGKLIQLMYGGTLFEKDDVLADLLSIQYVGVAAGGVTLTITSTAITSSGVDPSETELNIDLTVATTVQDVFDAINANSAFTITFDDKSYAKMASSSIDNISAQDVKTSAYAISANVQAIIDAFNSFEVVKATIVAEADRIDVDNLADFVYLANGSNGTAPSVSDWSTALGIAYAENADGVGLLSGDSSIQALLSSHVSMANTITGRKERRGITGCDSADNDATVKSKAKIIDNQAVAFCGSRDYDFDLDGQEVKMPGYLHAMKIFGMTFGNEVIEPVTHKKVKVTKLAKKYSGADIINFIKAGVMMFVEGDAGGYQVERGVTTYQGNNLIANEWSMIGTVLAITKRHRTRLQERFVGRAGTKYSKSEIEAFSLRELELMLQDGWFTEGDGQPFVSNHVVTVAGDTFDIKYNGVVTSPINFILTTHNFELLGLGR